MLKIKSLKKFAKEENVTVWTGALRRAKAAAETCSILVRK